MTSSSKNVVADLQNELKITQSDCATLLGIEVESLRRYNEGVKPSKEHAKLFEMLSNPITLLHLLRDKETSLGIELHERLMRYAVSRIPPEELVSDKYKQIYAKEIGDLGALMERMFPSPFK